MLRLLIVIPAFNEEINLGRIIKALPKKLPRISRVDTLVIDDGSRDETARVAKKNGAFVLHHLINRGLGAALGTGFAFAINKKYDLIATIDADGQHSPHDIHKLISPLVNNQADVVIGSRLLNSHGMPFIRFAINVLSDLITFLLFNIWTTDSQSGMRAFTREALSRIKIRSQKMEVSSEIFKEISRLHLHVVEVPIAAIYTRYSLNKGQAIANAPNVFWKLILHKFI